MGTYPTLADRELLIALGMCSARGHLSERPLRKLRQIEGMLPWLTAALREHGDHPATVVEFGCGKGYVGFFLARACRELGLRSVRIVGVDRWRGAVDRCRQARDALGWEELEFAVSTCEEFAVRPAPALVTALHACDVATDHALATAIALGAEHIVVAPCCHHTTQRKLREAGHRHVWGYAARSFPVLGSRLSEFITDGMRCLCLRANGYDVQVREFVSGTATPKNIVLVARRAPVHGDRALVELRRLERAVGVNCEVRMSLERRGPVAGAEGSGERR